MKFNTFFSNPVVRKSIVLAYLIFISHGILLAQRVTRVEHVTLTVSDMQRSVAFYTDILGFEMTGQYEMPASMVGRVFGMHRPVSNASVATLRLGNETIELISFPQSAGREIPFDSRSNDLWFQHIAIVVSDMQPAYARLVAADVEHNSTAPQTLPESIPAAAGITAFYFRDPDGHPLELIHYPAGKGDPRWQSDASLFLGIDHTAIGIDHTQQSLSFYQDLLKLDIAGTSENAGSEQEHLNQVFGARVRITGLKATEGFGIEFLDYIAPPGGRPAFTDSHITDLWHWYTTLTVDDLTLMRDRLTERGYRICGESTEWKDRRFLCVQDPDGHVMLLQSEDKAVTEDSD
jgi:catechol 2,3-dioxygenase-like lactoylglutathione lyase family enzyme